MLNAEAFADGALGVFDFTIHVLCWNADESRAQIRDQRLKTQPLFQLLADVRCGFFSHTLTLNGQQAIVCAA